MSNAIINIYEAKTRLSQLVKRAEQGERITIARAGKPVAQLGPVPVRRGALPPNDPLLNLDTFAVEGKTIGRRRNRSLTNAQIDQLLYGKP